MTASDIATQIAQRASLKVGKVTATTTVFPTVSQAGQTDWEILLSGLAATPASRSAVRDGAFSFGPPTASAGAPASGTAPAPRTRWCSNWGRTCCGSARC